MKHQPFLNSVMLYVKEHPEVAPRVTEYAAHGIQMALRESLERAADFEATTMLLYVKDRKRLSFLKEKLAKWNGRAALRWDSVVKELE